MSSTINRKEGIYSGKEKYFSASYKYVLIVELYVEIPQNNEFKYNHNLTHAKF